ncbi:MAG: SBBP repeat-containing protein [Bacteroidia bacterium]|nr:SBBP repeat-containing protein [Bacteroidia bacterium]
MNKFIYALIFLLVSVQTEAQNLFYAKTFGGSGGENLLGMVTDQAGNVYSTGWFTGTADFDPGIGVVSRTSAGNRDVFVCKLNPAGNYAWVKTFGGTGGDEGMDVHVAADGSVYVAGIFFNTVNFDPGVTNTSLTSFGNWDAFVVKFDSLGTLQWARQLGGTGAEDIKGLSTDQAGNVYVGGTFSGTADFNPSTAVFNMVSQGSTDVYVCKLSPQGNFIWARQLGSTINEALTDIKVDLNNRLVITGTYRGTVDFDVNVGVQSRTANTGFNMDNWITKWDTASNFIWVQVFGGTSFDQSNSIAIDAQNNIVNCGHFASTVDFDPGAGILSYTALGAVDNYILKLDSAGSFLWAKAFGGDQNQTATAIAVDDSSNIYCPGWFKDTADFDPNTGVFSLISTAGTEDVFVLKLNDFGAFMWAYQIGSGAFEIGNALAVRSTDNLLFVAGHFNSTPDFDPGPSLLSIASQGSTDAFVQAVTLNNNPALPVSFNSFLVRPEPTGNALFWETISELNNKGFEIERSFDALYFEKIGFIKGTYNSKIKQSYTFFDKQMLSAYYRLKQIDVDGKFSYSSTVFAHRIENHYKLGPNPFDTYIELLDLQGDEHVELLDLQGNVLMQANAEGSIMKLDTEQLGSGLYVLKIWGASGVKSYKLLK